MLSKQNMKYLHDYYNNVGGDKAQAEIEFNAYLDFTEKLFKK
jgi:hypothetical protein